MLVDNSMLAGYSRCQWYYGLRYELHRASNKPKLATDIGTLVHQFWSVYLGGYDVQKELLDGIETITSIEAPKDQIDIAVGKYQGACLELLTTYPMLIDANGTKLILHQDKSPRWIIRYPEIAFQMPLCAKHTYMGRMDVIVEDGNRQLFIIELKTSGFANQPTWREYWRLATQPIGYMWAASLHTTKIINGSIIIPIFMTTRQKNNVKYGMAQMTDEIKLIYTPQQIESWKDMTINLCDEIERSKLIPTGRYNGGCSSSATGRCDYFDSCHAGYNMSIIEQSTHELEWSPLG